MLLSGFSKTHLVVFLRHNSYTDATETAKNVVEVIMFLSYGWVIVYYVQAEDK